MPSQPKISLLTSLFKSEKYLKHFLDEIQMQSIFADCEFVFVLNEASEIEKNLCEQANKDFSDQIRILYVNPVENLGASWNRAWKAARAPYVAMWNVDDRRYSDSLQAQYEAMEAHPKWQLCYGDYIRVTKYGLEDGEIRKTPKFSIKLFRRAFPQGGAFWLMRKDIGEELGLFDEQFKVGPDLDLSIRMAEAGLEMGRVDQTLGFFTDAEEGLSTREGGLESAIERSVIQLRYGIFDKVRVEHIVAAQKYRIGEIQNLGKWTTLEKYLPMLNRSLEKRKPLWTLGKLRNGSRSLLNKMGLLQLIYSIQKRFIGKEI
jgi:glycosyltransferase involved in cell wall biosynthesis